MTDSHHRGIWLEVDNARLETADSGPVVRLQLVGDKADREPAWWRVEMASEDDKPLGVYQAMARALDRGQTVRARLCSSEDEASGLAVKEYRIQHKD